MHSIRTTATITPTSVAADLGTTFVYIRNMGDTNDLWVAFGETVDPANGVGILITPASSIVIDLGYSVRSGYTASWLQADMSVATEVGTTEFSIYRK
jgi:hypothetical protein